MSARSRAARSPRLDAFDVSYGFIVYVAILIVSVVQPSSQALHVMYMCMYMCMYCSHKAHHIHCGKH